MNETANCRIYYWSEDQVSLLNFSTLTGYGYELVTKIMNS